MDEITVCKNKIILPHEQGYLQVEDIPFYLAKTQYPLDADSLKCAGVRVTIEDKLKEAHLRNIKAYNPLTKIPSEDPRWKDIVFPDDIVSYAKEFCTYDIEVVQAEPYVIDVGKSAQKIWVSLAIEGISNVKKLYAEAIRDDLIRFIVDHNMKLCNADGIIVKDNSNIDRALISLDDFEQYVMKDGGQINKIDDDHSKLLDKISKKRMPLGEACWVSAWGASSFPVYNVNKEFDRIFNCGKLQSIENIEEFQSGSAVIADRYIAARSHIRDVSDLLELGENIEKGGEFKFVKDKGINDYCSYTVDFREFIIWCNKNGFTVNPDVWECLFPEGINNNHINSNDDNLSSKKAHPISQYTDEEQQYLEAVFKKSNYKDLNADIIITLRRLQPELRDKIPDINFNDMEGRKHHFFALIDYKYPKLFKGIKTTFHKQGSSGKYTNSVSSRVGKYFNAAGYSWKSKGGKKEFNYLDPIFNW